MVRVRLREALTAGVREGIAQRWDSSPASPQGGQTTSLGRPQGPELQEVEMTKYEAPAV